MTCEFVKVITTNLACCCQLCNENSAFVKSRNYLAF